MRSGNIESRNVLLHNPARRIFPACDSPSAPRNRFALPIAAAFAARRMRSGRQYRGREFSELAVLRNLRRDPDRRDSANLRRDAPRDLPVAAADCVFEPRGPDGMHRVAHLLQPNLMNTATRIETETETESSMTLRFAGHLLSAAIVIATIIVGLYVARLYYLYPRTDDAYVRANWVGIAPHVSGPITELPIVDNQYVKQGDLLFVVDPRPYQAALDAATAKLQLTELDIRALEDAIRTAKSDQVRLEADAAYAKQYLDRIQPLLAKHFVTANDVFNARSRVSAAEAAVAGRALRRQQGAKPARPVRRYQRTAQSRGGRRLRRETQRRLLLRPRAVQRLGHQSQHRGGPVRQRRPCKSSA